MDKPELDEMNNNENNDDNNGHLDINLVHDNYSTDPESDSESDSDTDDDESDIFESLSDCIDNNNNIDSILKHHYHHHKNVHMNDKHVIQPYAFGQPFIVSFPHNHTTGRLVHKIIYQRLYSWIGNDDIIEKPPPILNEDDTSEDIEQEW
eukprot:CAMPEP_0201578112 /NCGR_PEP_ID=MMETSP0190_2-20130828/24824_1 /ASSEMBLY_ACC=CAM_ASM_000263 /TAXON_ID=37353 /ORGANISM="Rosalina sp." /LENGTH=149 /DNA_ID=CAMNT_0048010929 /DNA_START=1617 /DNA_END=2063 /DNA_ORIENTATION=+